MGSKDTLMRLLPEWYAAVKEYEGIMEAYGYEFDKLDARALQVYLNRFVQTCDMETIKYWETKFNLSVRVGDTDEYRRERVIIKLSQTVPYTIWDLRNRLNDLFGADYSMTVDPANNSIKFIVTSSMYGATDLLYDLIWDRVPAHLTVIANQQITNYCVSKKYVPTVTSATLIQTITPGGN